MSYHHPPPSNMPPVHMGTQGSILGGYMPPSTALPPGLPPPPLPPPFPGFPGVPPPGQVLQPPMMQKLDGPMQSSHPPFVRKPHDLYEKKRDHQYHPMIMSDKPTVTVFVGNITEHASDALIRQLLMKCGIVVNWKRVQGADGKLQAFGFCEYIDAEAGLRAIRLLHDLSVGEKNLVVKVDAKTKAMLEEYKQNKASLNRAANGQNNDMQNGEEELDEATLTEDSVVRKNITGLLTDNGDVLSGKYTGSTTKWKASHSGNEENLEGMGMDKDKKHLISREIRFFRDAYKDSEKDKKDRGKEQDKEYEKENKERDNDRDREKERDRDRGKERQRDRNRSQERDNERNRNDERRSRDRSRSRDRDRGGREERGDKGRQTRELDEDEQYEKRKRERKLKERNQAFVERLKIWEARERKRLREYDRELEKEREQENELSREKKHLLEFLEDYDDERDDPKYYRGSSFDRRLQARVVEMESDDKDRQRELEELEEVRKRLGEKTTTTEEEDEVKQKQPAVEMEPETRPSLQATFKPAVHLVQSAPKVPSPAQESPRNSPKVNMITKSTHEENTDMDGETMAKKTFGFEMKGKSAVGSSNSNRKKLEAVFNSEEDSAANQTQKRKLVPLDYSEEEMNAVSSAAKTAAKTAEDKKKSIKTLIERIPTAKDELFAYSLDWECVDQSLIDRRIRPWVNKKIVEYIGEEEQSLVDFMCSKLLARSQPENILRDVSMVLDDEAEVFVVKMWRLLIYETEAKKIGLVK